MHRPGFTLVVLLEWLAASLCLVGTAQSQTTSSPSGPSGVFVFAWPLDTDPYECLYDDCDGVDFGTDESTDTTENDESFELLRDTRLTDDLPWTPAVESGAASYEFVPTGYDSSYDFAMLSGTYLDLVSTDYDDAYDVGYECGLGYAPDEVVDGSNFIPLLVVDGPATSLYCRDYDTCIDGTYRAIGTGCPGYTHCDFEPQAIEWDCHSGEVETVASPVDATTLAAKTLDQLSDHLAQVWQRTVNVSDVVWQSWWNHYDLHVACRSDLWTPAPSPATTEVVHIERPAMVNGYEEIVLMKAAITLDQLSLRMQEVAQQLRYLAADRILGKTNSRRIAARNE